MNLFLEEEGKAVGYENYHYGIFFNGEKIGTADLDRNQDLYICIVDFKGKRSKRFYHPTDYGIRKKVEAWLAKEFPEEVKEQQNGR